MKLFTELIRSLLEYAHLAVPREEKLRRMFEGVTWFREEALFFHDDPATVLVEMQNLHDELTRAAVRGGESGELLLLVVDQMLERGWVARDSGAGWL